MQDVRNSLVAQAGLLGELMTSAIEPALRHAGLTLASFELLSAAHALKSKAKQAEIASRLGITPASLSESIHGAVRAGFVVQEPGANDARTKLIRVTPKGLMALNTVVVSMSELESSMVAGLSEAEIASAIRLLERANRNLALEIQKSGNETDRSQS